MVHKPFLWADGVKLEDHSKRKHKILREYFAQYLTVRCRNPHQQRFRLAIVDGFSGGGRYICGSPGSPLIFVEELRKAIDSINLERAAQNLGQIEIECFLIFNDDGVDAIDILETNIAPLLAEAKQNAKKLHLEVRYLKSPFEEIFPNIRSLLAQGNYRNVLFNLDQGGHSHVERTTLIEIMASYPSAEIFYTFVIESLLAFLRKSQSAKLMSQLAAVGVDGTELQKLQGVIAKSAWLGVAERIVFEAFKNCAPYVSPFSINNPEGWRYWLIHFANSFRARQVYNDVLHNNSSDQAHFGLSGLNMLSYDPSQDVGALYLFDVSGRKRAKAQLMEDIPRLVTQSGDAIAVGEFYEGIYNATPAHTDDIHAALIENPDLQVVTETGGERRKPNTIGVGDVIKLRRQTSFFPMFLKTDPKK